MLLDIRNLSVTFGRGAPGIRVVRDLSLSVKQGEMFCVVGESGSGKSMTMLAVMNLLAKGARRSGDAIQFGSRNLLDLNERAMGSVRGRDIGMIFQEPMTSLNPAFTIGEQLTEVHRRHMRLGRARAWKRAGELLTLVGIPNAEERLRQYPHQLSGGLRQRVMIAMALMCEPSLLIADEPTSALDVTIQVQVLSLLKSLQRELGIGIILITHDLGVVSRIADRIAVMYAGQVVEMGDRADIFLRPRHPYTRGLLRSIPDPERHGRHEPLFSIPGTVPNLGRLGLGCSFHDRCAHAGPECLTRPIALEHNVRCIRELPPFLNDAAVTV